MKATLKHQYAWQVARQKIDSFIEQLNNYTMYEGWVKAQLIIEAQARYYAHTGSSVETAISMAWEDFDMACRGRGEPGITGAVLHLWAKTPDSFDIPLRNALEFAFQSAREATEPNKLRYHPKEYTSRVRTLDDSFDLPEAIPLIHAPVIEALNNAKDIKAAINQISDFRSPPFTLIKGGKDEPEESPVQDDLF